MADVSSPVPSTHDGTQPPQESTASRINHWMHDTVREAQDLGKKAIHSNAAQQAKELGIKAIHSRASQEIRDSGQHIVHSVVQRGKDTANAGTAVVHDAQQGRVDPKHLVNAGEKAGVVALTASPHALAAEVVGTAVKDEVMRKSHVSKGTKQTIDHVTNPKKSLSDGLHQRVDEALKHLPVLELHEPSHKPKTADKD